jgi:hypothetical protein
MSQKEWKKPHVFISYVREDEAAVNILCAALEDRGLIPWRDRRRILAGQPWSDKIWKAIDEADYFLACFSGASESRDNSYMQKELDRAIAILRRLPREREWLIPVLLSQCEVPDLKIDDERSLRDLQWVDLYHDVRTGIEAIMRVIFNNTKHYPPIRLSSVGIEDKIPYLAHASDARENPLELRGDHFIIAPEVLDPDESFKIAVPVSGETEARRIVQQRREAGVLVGDRGREIDFDPTHNTLWLLSDNYEVDKLGEWNQNNVYRPKI